MCVRETRKKQQRRSINLVALLLCHVEELARRTPRSERTGPPPSRSTRQTALCFPPGASTRPSGWQQQYRLDAPLPAVNKTRNSRPPKSHLLRYPDILREPRGHWERWPSAAWLMTLCLEGRPESRPAPFISFLLKHEKHYFYTFLNLCFVLHFFSLLTAVLVLPFVGNEPLKSLPPSLSLVCILVLN